MSERQMSDDGDVVEVAGPKGVDTENLVDRRALSSGEYNTLRWASVGLYMFAATFVSLMPLWVPLELLVLLTINLVVVIGGLVAMLSVLVYPYFKTKKAMVVSDGMVLPKLKARECISDKVYIQDVRMDVFLYVMVPIIVLYAIILVLFPIPAIFLSMLLMILIFAVMAMVFWDLSIRCTPEALSFHFGPIGKRIGLKDIKAIRPVAVHAIKEFMGFGIRIGPDGAIGYISAGNTGVRITLADKEYVVTMRDPQVLVDYVRYHRDRR